MILLIIDSFAMNLLDYEHLKCTGDLDKFKYLFCYYGITEISRKLKISRNTTYYIFRQLNTLMIRAGEEPFFIDKNRIVKPSYGRPIKKKEEEVKKKKKTKNLNFSDWIGV